MSLLDKIKSQAEKTKIQLSRASYIVNSKAYWTQQLLAEGGYGTVHLVKDAEGNFHALKRMVLQTSEVQEMAKREIRLGHRVQNIRGVAQLLESDILSGKPPVALLVMNYYAGSLVSKLNKCIECNEPIPEKQLLKIFLQLALGVAALHSLDPPIIHRDLKIENILSSSTTEKGSLVETYVICDFGSAVEAPVTPTSTGRGILEEQLEKTTTLSYRAPEMVDLHSGKQIGKKADVWALGCVLYKMAYFVNPFEDGGRLKILSAKVDFPQVSNNFVAAKQAAKQSSDTGTITSVMRKAASIYRPELNSLISCMLTADPDLRPDISFVVTATEKLIDDCVHEFKQMMDIHKSKLEQIVCQSENKKVHNSSTNKARTFVTTDSVIVTEGKKPRGALRKGHTPNMIPLSYHDDVQTNIPTSPSSTEAASTQQSNVQESFQLATPITLGDVVQDFEKLQNTTSKDTNDESQFFASEFSDNSGFFAQQEDFSKLTF